MQNILLLHGAIGAKDQFQLLGETLKNDFEVFSMNFSGHGGKSITEKDFSIPLFADDVLNYMSANNIENTNIFGYSMGGYVGMYLTKHFPGKVNKLITLAAKWHWDADTAMKESKMLNAETFQQKIPAFVSQLEKRYAPADWKTVLEKTRDMILQLGENNVLKPADCSTINTPCLLLLGDRDKMVTLEETVSVYKSLPDAQHGILPGTQHPIEQTEVQILFYLIKKFLG